MEEFLKFCKDRRNLKFGVWIQKVPAEKAYKFRCSGCEGCADNKV